MSMPNYGDPPFACPPDPMIGGVVIDLPVPPSVNRTRKIDRVGHKLFMGWVKSCTPFVLAAKCRAVNPVKFEKIKRFEIRVVLSEAHTKIDLDNSVKSLIDYLRHIEIIENDAQMNMRKLTVEWGIAPQGCRVTIIPWPMTLKDILGRTAEHAEAYP